MCYPYARRTGRLEHLIHQLALALGGRPAARFAQRLMLSVSNDPCSASSASKDFVISPTLGNWHRELGDESVDVSAPACFLILCHRQFKRVFALQRQ
jgi:hypothetical protein